MNPLILITDPAAAYHKARNRFVFWRDLKAFAAQMQPMLETLSNSPTPLRGQVFIHSLHGFVPALKEEFVYACLLRAQGYKSVFLLSRRSQAVEVLRRIPDAQILFWEDFFVPVTPKQLARAREWLAERSEFSSLLDTDLDGVSAGRNAISWYMRTQKVGTIEAEKRDALVPYLAESLAAAEASNRLLDRLGPLAAVLINERGYTPFGEFYDLALARGTRVVQYVASHRDDARIFRRYTAATKTQHPYGLSDDSWTEALAMDFPPAEQDRLLKFWEDRYGSKEWFNFQRIQHLAKPVSPAELREKLGLHQEKKTAAIFAHIFWDATFFYGSSIYADYQEWFVETVRLANQNPHVNWIVKLHPVNVWRLEADGEAGRKYSELEALAAAGVKPAAHVKILLPDTEVSTWSVFQVADFCLTVRGTVGMEMAALGKRVLITGTGPYSERGFTTNFRDRAEYEKALLNLQHEAPAATADARDRACRYAHWVLLRKPYSFAGFAMKYEGGTGVFHALNGRPSFDPNRAAEVLRSTEAKNWAEWMVAGKNPDCIGAGTHGS